MVEVGVYVIFAAGKNGNAKTWELVQAITELVA